MHPVQNMAVTGEVHFWTDQQAAVRLPLLDPGSDGAFREVFYATAFLLRQLSNLGSHPAGEQLARNCEPISVALVSDVQLASVPPIGLTDRAGRAGDRSIVNTLTVKNGAARQVQDQKGFGWFARGVEPYSRDSAPLLLYVLAERRKDDDNFRGALSTAVVMAAYAHGMGKVNVFNHPEIALGITETAFGHPRARTA